MAPKGAIFLYRAGYRSIALLAGQDAQSLRGALQNSPLAVSDQQFALISTGQAEQRPRHAGILQRRLTCRIKMTNNASLLADH